MSAPIDPGLVKDTVVSMGADICGIASSRKFNGAPEGFRPSDVYSACKSVVVFAKRIPPESLFISNCVPYTFVNSMATQEVDKLTVEISRKLEDLGIDNVSVPLRRPI